MRHRIQKAAAGVRRNAELGVGLGLGLSREATAHVLATKLYPFGLFGSVPAICPPWKKRAHAQTAVLFVHGVFHNRSAFAFLKSRMAWEGFSLFSDLNLYTSLYDIPTLATRVASEVQRLLEKKKARRVIIVAHSMGGIITRYYLHKLKPPKAVDTIITLGTAHQGAYLSRLSLLPHLHDLAPGSRLICELNTAKLPRHIKALNLFGSLDLILKPTPQALWKGAENRRLDGVGHLGILFSRRAAKAIVEISQRG